MQNTELYVIEKELNDCQQELVSALHAYEAVHDLEDMKREVDKHLVSEDLAYTNTIKSISLGFGAEVPSHIEAFPESLDALDMEGFKARFKEIKDTVWKTLSEAFQRFKNLIRSWYKKLSELFRQGGDDAHRTFKDTKEKIKYRVELAEKYGFKRGDKVDQETYDQILKTHGQPPAVTFDMIAMSYDDFEKDILSVFDIGASGKALLKNFSVNGDNSNIVANIKEAYRKINAMVRVEHASEVTKIAIALHNITTKGELESFLDESTNDSTSLLESFIEEAGFSKEKSSKKSLTSGEIIGGRSIEVTSNTLGYLTTPSFTSLVRSVSDEGNVPRLTMSELLDTVDSNSEASAVVEEANRISSIINGEIEKITGVDMKDSKLAAKTVKSVATSRNSKEAERVIKSIKSASRFAMAWVKYSQILSEETISINKNVQKFLKAINKSVSDNILKETGKK